MIMESNVFYILIKGDGFIFLDSTQTTYIKGPSQVIGEGPFLMYTDTVTIQRFTIPSSEREWRTPATDTGESTLQREKNDRRRRHDDRQTGPYLDEILCLVTTGSHNHQIALMGEREDEGAAGAVGHGEKRHTDIDAA